MAPDIPKDSVVARIAARQHGNVTRAQLLKAGFTDNAIARRVAAGQLYRVHNGVYAVGRPPQTALERASAAVLACGPTAALSHLPALALYELAGWPASVKDVVVSEDRRPSGIRVHLVSTLLPRDVRRRHGIRVTSPARTILDCTPSLSDKRLTRLVNEAIRRKLLKPHHLEDLLLRCPTHPGTPRLRPFTNTGRGPTRSELEDRFQRLIKRYGLPEPKLNTNINGYEADCYFEDYRLIVELDGWDFHNSRASFESDRTRDVDIYDSEGIPTIRITNDRMKAQPAAEASRLERILQRRAEELSLASERARPRDG